MDFDQFSSPRINDLSDINFYYENENNVIF
jgi:hypothetical protein